MEQPLLNLLEEDDSIPGHDCTNHVHILHNALMKICSFVVHYLPLANTHNTDFIVGEKWNLIPIGIADELLSLTTDELVELPSCKNTSKYSPSSSASMETLQLCPTGTCTSSGQLPRWNNELKPNWIHDYLQDFLAHAKQCTLPDIGVVSNEGEFFARLRSDSGERIFVNKFMSMKKCHEIDSMTQLCNLIAKSCALKEIVDIGSGRGYLGCHLAFMHGYRVLGIDSSEGNTQSAEKRLKLLQKHWDGLLKNAAKSVSGDAQALASKNPPISREARNKLFTPVTQFVTPSTDLLGLLDTQYIHADDTLEGGNDKCATSSVVDAEHTAKESRTIMITGLHTCGNLGPSILKLFVSNRDARVVCNVGCCYNHLDEEYLRGPYAPDDDVQIKVPGFPMSKYLRDKGIQLGRNARMLSLQAPDRILEDRKLPAKSIFWRALLQVILRDITAQTRDDWHVGKIAATCSSFLDYVRKALAKLRLNETYELSDEEILEYERKYQDAEHKMNIFFQLRAALAAPIESLILLDRLLYLREQSTVKEAHIFQLFDPIKSPRCYALVALK